MINWEERRLLVKVSSLYYKEGLTQMQVAKKIGVSRPIISKMLQKAKEMEIVEIYIKDENLFTVELEIEIAKKFNLKDVIVVPTDQCTNDMVKQKIGQVSASYVNKLITDEVKSLGISWGTTLAEFVRQYPYERRSSLEVIPLIGGMGTQQVEIHSNQLAYELAKKVNGSCSYLYAPAFVEKREIKERLIEMDDISSVLEKGKRVDIAIVGIGNPIVNSTMTTIGYLKEKDLQELIDEDAIGDICSRFYNEAGEEVSTEINEKVISIPLEDLKNIQLVVGIVEGIHKQKSILAALKGNFIDVLIIDDMNAKELIRTNQL